MAEEIKKETKFCSKGNATKSTARKRGIITCIIFSMAVLLLLSTIPVSHGEIEIQHELPFDIQIGKKYKDVLVEIREDDSSYGYDGVERVTLTLNDFRGQKLVVLDQVTKDDYKTNLDDGYEQFYLTFKIPKDVPLAEGRVYTLEIETRLYDYFEYTGNEYYTTESEEYLISIEKGQNPYIYAGIIIGVILVAIVVLLLVQRKRKEKE